jgi:hypothetical protein
VPASRRVGPPGQPPGVAAAAQWVQTVEAQLDILARQIERMQTARALLDHVLHHHQDSSPDGCPHYEALIWQSDNTGRPSGRRGAVDTAPIPSV